MLSAMQTVEQRTVSGMKSASSHVHQVATQTLGKVHESANKRNFNLGETLRNTLIGGAVGGAAGGALLLSKISLPLLGKVTSLAGVAKFAGVGGGIGLAAALLPVVMPSIDKHPLIKAALTGTSIGATLGMFIPFVSPIFGAIAGAAIGVAVHLLRKSNVSASFTFGSGHGWSDWNRGNNWNRGNQWSQPLAYCPPGFQRRGFFDRVLNGDGYVPINNRTPFGNAPNYPLVPPMGMPFSPYGGMPMSPYGGSPYGMLGMPGPQGMSGMPMAANGQPMVSGQVMPQSQPAAGVVQPAVAKAAAAPPPRKVSKPRNAAPKHTAHAPAHAKKAKAKAGKPKPKPKPRPKPLHKPTVVATPTSVSPQSMNPYAMMDPNAMMGMQMLQPGMQYGMGQQFPGMPNNAQVNVMPMAPGMMPNALPQAYMGANPQGMMSPQMLGMNPQFAGMNPQMMGMAQPMPYGLNPAAAQGMPMIPGL